VAGAAQIRLVTLPLSNVKGDHVDWALARFERQ
jgi:hypothetical protein